MFLRRTGLAVLLLLSYNSFAQQFLGQTSRSYTAIQQMPFNPSWVNNAESGTEINVFGVSVLAGTNAYLFRRDKLGGNMVEGVDYFKDPRPNKKHAWANVDILGPAASFTVKDIHHVGFYTRMREIFRAGNIEKLEFQLLGDMLDEYLYKPLNFSDVGGSSHAFAEVGITYGREIKNDYYSIWRGGVTIKYLMGFSAGSAYSKRMTYVQSTGDSLARVEGDLTGLFTYNMNPLNGSSTFDAMALAERAGRGSLGMDIGIQYEYHPNPNPNEESEYAYSIAASITDIGAITYIADTGSGSYKLTINQNTISNVDRKDGEALAWYVGRLGKDSLLTRTTNAEKFRMGLPTALRINADYNVTKGFNMACNILLNMRGTNGEVYKPGYVSYFNLTPTFGSRVKIGLPFTFVGYQTVIIGATLNAGPFYFGSNGLFSSVLSKNIKNADVYTGLTLKFKKKQRNYYTY